MTTKLPNLLKDFSTQELHDFDPVAEAEALAKMDKEGKTDPMGLAFYLAHMKSEAMKERAAQEEDVSFGANLSKFVGLAISMGFEQIHEIDFAGGEDEPEKLLYFLHPDQVLLRLETYQSQGINKADIYFDALVQAEEFWRLMISRSFPRKLDGSKLTVEEMDAGFVPATRHCQDCSVDVREGLRYWLNRLKPTCTFTSPLKEIPFGIFLTYQDWHETKEERQIKATERSVAAPETLKKFLGI